MKKTMWYVLALLAGLYFTTMGRAASRGALPDTSDSAISAWFSTHQLFAVGAGILLLAIAVLGVYAERRK